MAMSSRVRLLRLPPWLLRLALLALTFLLGFTSTLSGVPLRETLKAEPRRASSSALAAAPLPQAPLAGSPLPRPATEWPPSGVGANTAAAISAAAAALSTTTAPTAEPLPPRRRTTGKAASVSPAFQDGSSQGTNRSGDALLLPPTADSQCLQGGVRVGGDSNVVGDGGGAPPLAGTAAIDLLVLILSSQQKELYPARRRAAVRRSWARVTTELGTADARASERCSVRYIFVVGSGRQPEPRMLASDVLELPVEDGYRQITHKVLGALRWAVERTRFRYLLKTDDDSFVCVARLLELLRPLKRERLYLGVVNQRHHVITAGRAAKQYERWKDPSYVQLFNRSVYAPYMQGAGYVLSADLAQVVVDRASRLPRIPAVEDALVGTLVEDDAEPLSRPEHFRHKNRDDYAVTVCERDTEFVLLHKLDEKDLGKCRGATQRRRSERCPQGPCLCRSLGHKPRRPKEVLRTFAEASRAAGRGGRRR